jgi:ABC-type Na+ efflux pump permease subunit
VQRRNSQEREHPEKKFDLHRIFSSAEIVLVGKDLGMIWRHKGTRAMLMLLPAVLTVALPLMYSVAISFLPADGSIALPAKLVEIVGGVENVGPRRQWMAAFTTLLCPMLYLCVPVICSVTAAARVFVGEKEGDTLETLMLSSMDVKSILHAKVTCCTLLSVAVSVLSFVAFAITVSVADILMGAPFFLNLEWLVCLVLLTPVIALFSVVFVSWELPRVHSVGEAMQTMGYLMLPLLLLYLIQFTGVFHITVPLLLVVAALLAVLSVVLFNVTGRQFQPDRLFANLQEE